MLLLTMFSKSERVSINDEAAAISLLTPAPDKYNTLDISLNLKYVKHKIVLDKANTHRMDKIVKKNCPDFGDPVKSLKYAYDHSPSFSPGKEKKISFAEVMSKRKAFVPSVGQYEVEKAYSNQSFCHNSITSRKR